jgi:membrane-associated phospholipid phosphatase
VFPHLHIPFSRPGCALALALLGALSPTPASAQEAGEGHSGAALARHQAADTAAPPPLFVRADAAYAAGVTAAVLLLSTADVKIRRSVRSDAVQASRPLIEATRAFNRINETTLTAGGIVLWGVGRLAGRETLADVALHTVEGVVVASLASQVIRGPLGRARPRVSPEDQYEFQHFQGFRNIDYRAFPSIHTSSAFAAAAVLSGEARRRWPEARGWISPAAYALAATPGLARMHLDQHWASDVAMGAFIGILVGQKVVRWNHDIAPGNRVDRLFLGRTVVNGEQRSLVGFQLGF